jgi:TPP-dependent 2-oxoacid decarboxylase
MPSAKAGRSCSGVGELSAICGVGGAYAEHVPVIHLVGMPARGVQAAHRRVHHTLGNGEFGLFSQMAEPVVCAQAIMTPGNCVAETERLIAAALSAAGVHGIPIGLREYACYRQSWSRDCADQ